MGLTAWERDQKEIGRRYDLVSAVHECPPKKTKRPTASWLKSTVAGCALQCRNTAGRPKCGALQGTSHPPCFHKIRTHGSWTVLCFYWITAAFRRKKACGVGSGESSRSLLEGVRERQMTMGCLFVNCLPQKEEIMRRF